MLTELSLHIEYLLRNHDCLIVPGFGAFMATRRSASYCDGKLMPPCVDYCFNRELRSDDGLLANSFARRRGVSFEEGKIMLSECVEALKRELQANRETTFGRIGSLSLKDEDTLEFHPFRSALASSEALGLPVLSLAAEESEKAIEKEEVAVEDASEIPSPEAEPSLDLEERRALRRDKYWYIPVNKMFARIAACVLVVVAVGLQIWYLGGREQQPNQYASVVPAEAIRKEASRSPQKTIAAPEAASPTVSAEAEEEGKYFLIVGTFATEAEAQQFIASKDDSSLKAIKRGKRVRVSAASSDNREALLSLMREERFKAEHPDSWIWEAD